MEETYRISFEDALPHCGVGEPAETGACHEIPSQEHSLVFRVIEGPVLHREPGKSQLE